MDGNPKGSHTNITERHLRQNTSSQTDIIFRCRFLLLFSSLFLHVAKTEGEQQRRRGRGTGEGGTDLAVRPTADANLATDFLEDGGADAELLGGLVDGEVKVGGKVIKGQVSLLAVLGVVVEGVHVVLLVFFCFVVVRCGVRVTVCRWFVFWALVCVCSTSWLLSVFFFCQSSFFFFSWRGFFAREGAEESAKGAATKQQEGALGVVVVTSNHLHEPACCLLLFFFFFSFDHEKLLAPFCALVSVARGRSPRFLLLLHTHPFVCFLVPIVLLCCAAKLALNPVHFWST